MLTPGVEYTARVWIRTNQTDLSPGPGFRAYVASGDPNDVSRFILLMLCFSSGDTFVIHV